MVSGKASGSPTRLGREFFGHDQVGGYDDLILEPWTSGPRLPYTWLDGQGESRTGMTSWKSSRHRPPGLEFGL